MMIENIFGNNNLINKMNIAYACDDNYITHTGISMLSLLENNLDVEKINIYLISVNISSTNIEKIKNLVTSFRRKLVIIPFNELCPNLKISKIGRHIETVYAKLFFGNIKNVDKIIYLDSDIIINGSLEEMWNINLLDNHFGLVKTTSKDSVKLLGLKKNDNFYNDGVALVNAKKLREDNMIDKFQKFIDKFNGNPPVLSEGTINVVCKKSILEIHPKFNYLTVFSMFKNRSLSVISNEKEFYPNAVINEARNSPIVIHYLAGWYNRPWEQGCKHPLKDQYLYYKNKSVWKNVPLVKKKIPKKLLFHKFISRLLPIEVVQLIIQSYRLIK